MTSLWTLVDAENNVVGGPFERPAMTRLGDGTVINLTILSDAELAQYGLYPYVEQPVSYDLVAQIQIASTLTFDQANSVVVASANFMNRDLTDAQGIMLQRVNEYRDSLLAGGWVFNGIRYDSDPRSVQNMAGTQTLINAGFTLPADFKWRASDNTDHGFTNQTFLYFFTGAAQWRSAAFTVSWYHKANISALTNSHDVAAYDYTAGWVLGYNIGADGLDPVTA